MISQKGKIYGPVIFLYWQDIHTFGYYGVIKVKVQKVKIQYLVKKVSTSMLMTMNKKWLVAFLRGMIVLL